MTARQRNEVDQMEGTRQILQDIERLPFPDCALPGCDGYAEEGEMYCEQCLKALRASIEGK